MVTDGGFDDVANYATNWRAGGGADLPTIADGIATYTQGGYLYATVATRFSVVAGALYKISFDILSYTSGDGLKVGIQHNDGSTADVFGNYINSIGTHHTYLVALASVSTAHVLFYSSDDNFTGTADNFSVKKVTNDLVGYWGLDSAVQVLNFDGSSQINLASTITLAEDTAWSISFWQHQGGDDDSYIIGMNSESPARYKIRHRSNLIRVYFPSTSNDLNATDVLTEWTHIVITCDGTDSSNLKYYLEGSLEDTGSVTNSAFNIDTIGGAGGSGFDGKLAQVAVYDKALSAGEVTSQLNLGASGDWSSDSNLLGYWKMDNATTVTDLSGNGNHGTVDGATLVDGYIDDSTGNGNFGDMQ